MKELKLLVSLGYEISIKKNFITVEREKVGIHYDWNIDEYYFDTADGLNVVELHDIMAAIEYIAGVVSYVQ